VINEMCFKMDVSFYLCVIKSMVLGTNDIVSA
jgi:hypothetical protein